MEFFDDIYDAVCHTAKSCANATSDLAKNSKKAIKNAAIKERLSKQYAILGMLVCKDEDICSALNQKDDEYREVLLKIKQLISECEENNK